MKRVVAAAVIGVAICAGGAAQAGDYLIVHDDQQTLIAVDLETMEQGILPKAWVLTAHRKFGLYDGVPYTYEMTRMSFNCSGRETLTTDRIGYSVLHREVGRLPGSFGWDAAVPDTDEAKVVAFVCDKSKWTSTERRSKTRQQLVDDFISN